MIVNKPLSLPFSLPPSPNSPTNWDASHAARCLYTSKVAAIVSVSAAASFLARSMPTAGVLAAGPLCSGGVSALSLSLSLSLALAQQRISLYQKNTDPIKISRSRSLSTENQILLSRNVPHSFVRRLVLVVWLAFGLW